MMKRLCFNPLCCLGLGIVLGSACSDHMVVGKDGGVLDTVDPPEVEISPATPTTLDVLEARVTEPEDGVEYTFSWSKDSAPELSHNGETLDAAQTQKWEIWTVTVTGHAMATGRTATGTATVTIRNTPPSITELLLDGGPLFTNSTAEAVLTSVDPDDDALTYTYTWLVDGAPVPETGLSLDGALWFDKGQTVQVIGSVSDGDSAPVSNSSETLIVRNTPPTKPAIEITPSAPIAQADDLLCVVTTPSQDADGDTITYEYEWVGPSGPISGDTITGSSTAEGDEWTCTVTPTDTEDSGPIAVATVRIEGCEVGLHEACPATSCQTLLADAPGTPDGVYWIDPDGSGAFETYCLMDPSYDGGGWTMVLVTSDDGVDTWTWTDRDLLTTDTTLVGAVTDLTKDFKAPSLHRLAGTDWLFIHNPSGVWASYDGVGDGTQSFGDVIEDTGSKCYSGHGAGVAMSHGTLTIVSKLKSTSLFLNSLDRDGQAHCTGNNDAWGPAWSMRNNNNGGHDDPGLTTLGPDRAWSSSEEAYMGGYSPKVGWGWALGSNTGTAGTGANHMQVFVRE